jgi:DNA-binding transcriptional MocR family regulator
MTDRATSARVARSAAAADVVAELGDWSSGTGPLFRQLAVSLRAGIERGALEPGHRLPSERVLAGLLSVSRGTAVAAYDQLVADGAVERREGSGTFVIGAGSLALPPGREGSALVARLVDRSTATATHGGTEVGVGGVVDLSISVLRDAEGLGSVAVGAADLQAVAPDTGYSPWGLGPLRSALAEVVTGWGLPSTADQVVVTTGAQQAISAAAACWVRPGDAVVVEDPTYPGAVSAFLAAGARLVGVPVDRNGVVASALEAAVAEHHPTLVYLQPTLHSPTGVVLSEARRRQIAQLLVAARVPLVEDHALAGLVWPGAGPLPAPIAAGAPDAPIAVVGSLSKRFWGGLRVGFVRAPEPVALRFARVKATQDLGSSAVSQVLASRLLADRSSSRRLARRNEDLRGRYELLASLLSSSLPDWRWEQPSGGLSLWVRLPRPVATSFAQAALRSRVAVATAEALSPGAASAHPDRLRLSFSGPSAEITLGVERLADAWRSFA